MIIKGKFITIEGMDGSGKTTQIQFIKHLFEKKGYKVLLTREPGGTVISEKIRSIILDKQHKEMDGITEALLYAAARSQHVSQVIIPALQRGEIVLCDRFVDSSLVYQGEGRNIGTEVIKSINDLATRGLEPHLTILFNIEPEVSMTRIAARGAEDRLEEEKLQFHKSVHNGYLKLAEAYSHRIKVVNGNRNIDDIRREVEALALKLINEGDNRDEISNCHCS